MRRRDETTMPTRPSAVTRACRRVTAAAGLALFAAPLAAQTGPGLAATGVAGAYVGLARGHQALDWNPANLGLDDNVSWSLGLPELTLTGSSIGPELTDLDVMVDEDLTDVERTEFLAELPTSGLGFRGNVEIPIVGIGIGSFAAGLSTTALFDASLSSELIDLYLYARQYGDIDYGRITEYRVGNTAFGAARYSTLKVGYASSFGPLSVGVTGRLVQGHSLWRGRLFEPEIDIVNSDFAVPAIAVGATGGTGLGLDLGVAMQPIPGLTVGLAVENLAQSMTWDEDALEVRGDSFTGTELSETGPAEFQDRLRARSFDASNATLEQSTVAADLFDESFFPRVVRGGATFRVPGTGTRLNGSFSATSGAGDLHVGWPRYIAVGIEQDFPIINLFTVRAGAASSMDGASALTGGLSLNLGPLHLNTAIGRIRGADPEEDPEGTYRFAERLAESSGYIIGVGLQIGG